jgi:drug/metabolite transporter (DMT)-like permease
MGGRRWRPLSKIHSSPCARRAATEGRPHSMVKAAETKETSLANTQVDDDVGASFGATDLLLLLMVVIWGLNFTVIKHSLEVLQPLAFNGLRMAAASILVVAVVRLTGKDLKVSRADGWRLFGLGLLANTCYQSLFIIGMAHTRAGNAALIVSTTPLFTALLGRLRRHEHFAARGILGLLLAFGGIVLIILSGQEETSLGETILGDALLVAGTICWSLYTVGSKPLVHVYGSTKATAFMMITGTPALLLICAPSLIRQDWSRVHPVAWAGVAFSAVFAIALAYIIWNYGVRRLGSTRTAVYGYLTPVVAILVAWPALGEKPTLGQLAGALVIFTGLYLVRGGMTVVAHAELEEEELEQATLGPGKN